MEQNIPDKIREMPSAKEAEYALLGSILLEQHLIEKAIAWIQTPDAFWRTDNRRLWECMLELYKKGETIDVITLGTLYNDKYNEVIDIRPILKDQPNIDNAETYAKLIWLKYLQRTYNNKLQAIAKKGYGTLEEFNEHIIETEHIIKYIREAQPTKFVPTEIILKDTIQHIQDKDDVVSFNMRMLDGFAHGMTKKEMTVIGGRPSMGKCLAKNTEVLMYDGSIKYVQDINIGDEIMGPDSKKRTVTSITNGYDNMYKIKPLRKGLRSWSCNESHILTLICSENINSKFRKDKIYNLSIKEYLSLPNRVKRKLKQFKSGVNFDNNISLPIDPYFIGLWLGDGHSSSSRITNEDKEIRDYLYNFSNEVGMHIKEYSYPNKCPIFKITNGKHINSRNGYSIQGELRKLKILNNKHIPQIYKTSNRYNRLKLLAGLIDSDGYLHTNYSYEIGLTNKKLSEDIIYLANSLGFVCYNYIKKMKYRNKSIVVYRNIISGNINEIPVLVNRKKAKIVTTKKNLFRCGINVESIGYGKYYGFELKEDPLFLLGDFTVTHNTTLIVNIAKAMVESGKKVMVFNREMSNIAMLSKIIVLESTLPYTKIRKRDFTKEEWEEVERTREIIQSKYKNLILYDSIRTLEEGIVEIRRHEPDIVIDDFIQLIKPPDSRKDRRFQIEDILTEYKWTAKVQNIPILLLSQLSREVDKRMLDEFKPKMSDLAEAGTIEQLCENVMFIHRPYVHMPQSESPYKAEIIAAKVRYGSIGTHEVGFDGNACKFYDSIDEALINRR